MERFIFSSILGFLTTLLVGMLICLMGLLAITRVVERKVMIERVNRDIQFLTSSLKETNTNSQPCQIIMPDTLGLENYTLNKKSTKEEIKASNKKLLHISQQAAQCYEKETKFCLLNKEENGAKRALYHFVKGLDIAGYQMKMIFNEQEKEYYKKIIKMNKRTFAKGTALKFTERAFPIYEITMKRLNNNITIFQNKNSKDL